MITRLATAAVALALLVTMACVDRSPALECGEAGGGDWARDGRPAVPCD